MKKIGNNCTIHESCQIPENVIIGNNVTIYSQVILEENVTIWDNCVIGRIPMGVKSNKRKILTGMSTLIKNGSVIGCNVVIYSGATIGIDNIIGDNSVIRENVLFEEDVVIGFNSSIQYNVIIGKGSRILQQSAVSSYTKIGNNNFISIGFVCVSDKHFGEKGYSEKTVNGPIIGHDNNIGPNVTIISNVSIGNNNTIGAHTLVTKNIGCNGIYYGVPAKFVKTK